MLLSNFFWGILICLNYFCLYSFSSLILGILLLMMSFTMSVLVGLHCLSWFSLIFFIMYMGGLLVLFFYVSSLSYNPMFSKSSEKFSFLIKMKTLFLFSFGMFSFGKYQKGFSFKNGNYNDFSVSLMGDKEFFLMVGMAILLACMLWLINKLTYRSRGALRSMFK